MQGKQDQSYSIKGSEGTWMNLGSELLVFSGQNIIYYTQHATTDGTLILDSKAFDAVSGKPIETGGTNPPPPPYGSVPQKPTTLEFDYSKTNQRKENRGPTPEGLYSIKKSSFVENKNESGTQKWSDLSPWQKIKSNLGGGTWPGGTDSWGSYRWQLNVESANTYGRDNMYLHGGTKWGSRGCIDVGNNIGTLANALLTNKTGDDKVYLQVVYPKDLKIKVANSNTNDLQYQK
jgi:hypothetical protein